MSGQHLSWRMLLQRAQLRTQLALRGAAWPWLAALALWLLAALAWLALPLAQQQEARLAASLQRSTQALQAAPVAAPPSDDASRLAALHAVLDQGGGRAQSLARLFALAAEEGWDIAEADYRLSPQQDGGLERLQITLPLSGSYPDIRALAEALLRGMPNLSLDDLSFERDNAEAAQLAATLKLSLWSRPGQGAQP